MADPVRPWGESAPELQGLPRVHGDPDRVELARLGIDPASLIDVSVNVNPFGPHPAVVTAIRAARLDAYPDRRATAAKRALGASLGVEPARLILGNGAAELLWTAMLALAFEPRRPLLVVGPTFGEPEAAARALGIPFVPVTMDAARGFEPEPRRIEASLHAHGPCVVYVCHPNNPTGRAMPTPVLAALVAAFPASTFLVDQAFLSLSERHADASVLFPDNALVLRSMTKDHALAGVRVAYAIGAPAIVARLENARPAWTVSSLAEAAIVAAVRHGDHVVAAREALLASRRELAAGLADLGLEVVPSETSFLLVRTGEADRVREKLLVRHGVLARSGTSFGLPDHLRLAARESAVRVKVLAAIAEVLADEHGAGGVR